MNLRAFVLTPLVLAVAAGCDSPTPEAGAAPAASTVEAVTKSALPAARFRPGRWAGVATDGYKGDSIQFTVSPGGVVSDVVFSGHWRCASSTSAFRTIKRMDVGHVPGTFTPDAGGAFAGEKKEPYLLWTVAGRFTGASAAAGTIRIEYHTECDTHRLSWTAAPVAS